jgi:F-type H+-transporting ATPase subunit a
VKKTIFSTFLFFNLIPNLYASEGAFTWISAISGKLGYHYPEHVMTFSLITIILVSVGLVYRAKLASAKNVIIPDSGTTTRNIIEAFGDFIMNQCKAVIGEKDGPKYFSTIAFFFIFIFLSNVIGLIPGFLPPTENLNTTFALGIFSFVYYNVQGCRAQGVVNYIKHFAGPLWYMAILIFPIEILSSLFRPMSLGLRLFGNMMGDHRVLSTFTELSEPMWIPIPVIFLALGLLVCFIQAYVFTMLSMVYISLAVSHQDHGDDHGH